MFDNLFNNLKDFVESKVKEGVGELEKLLAIPEPAAPFTTIYKFPITEPTITKGGIAVAGENLQIEAYKDENQPFFNTTETLRNVILFEVPEPNLKECVLACQFSAKAVNAAQSINVSLGFSKKGEWTTTKGWFKGVSVSDDFCFYEVRAYFKKETDPMNIQISVKFESPGILLIRDIELLQAPVKAG
ncbi:hypothetical protein H6G54_19615 [Anabaena cylindrica FACHB-243]|uniref:Uncharacterized protein n=1 Tax=Anabaena cylindrica (strain ATCC 27899 / PCC 7122) TaxID=272123 RepID=K9ZGD0_ANACC|nr:MULTISPECIES: hypothetical protein [Anabaena]AFZ58226.1 hypothetical protein Anacy_2792 [Anabaena cylindrica PCC 7122]MBD2419874.1 hypothetical protein [Anabaena cylindrica FACHB-243]MBY5281000.1 hypothetical protein [Anabaena sp. CCAP 1446/1C]MBY5307349.1 hypothetical protein [Anabaena sp. CCAP 1446/1C]MCM2407927.1 hypothetical protein [Anabaena sp. CCAP 1446/1C]